MTARTKGVRGTRSVFSTGIDAVNKQTVSESLEPMARSAYQIYEVHSKSEIRPFIQSKTGIYVRGNAYYQLTKTETIQANKSIVVVDKNTNKAYTGEHARDLIGLPRGQATRVRPDHNPQYEIYVQSTSVNRALMPNTRVLVKR